MRLLPLVLAWGSLVPAAVPAFSADLKIGQPAPPLNFTQLEQAPPGVKTDWASLHGKVVVLEFWATWCTACIEEIPHLNSLVHSVGSDNVIFIAVDDESPALTRKLLSKIPIDGWLGFDTSKKIIDAYDAETRPKTVVVDPEGRIAAVLRPEQLTGAQLAALAAGQNVAFPTDTLPASLQQAKGEAAALGKLADSPTGSKALFNISVLPGDPNGQHTMLLPSDDPAEPFKLDVLNSPVSLLISFMGLRLDRIRLTTYPHEFYSLHVSAPSGDEQAFGPAIQLAVASAAHLRLTRTNEEEDVWIIQAAPNAKSRLEPAGLGKGHMCFYDRKTGKLILQRGSLDKLAEALEYFLRSPVLNESGIPGNFDAAFDLSSKNPDEVNAALEKNMGLTLVRARRKVERIALDPLTVAASPPADARK